MARSSAEFKQVQRVTDPAEAGAALAEGRLVIAPTETVAGVFARADLDGALEKLREATGVDPLLAAWHAPAVDVLIETFKPEAPLHRRAIQRLAPGPVTFAIDGAEAPAPVCVERDADGARSLVRVPDHPSAAAMLSSAGGPVVALGAAAVEKGKVDGIITLDAGPKPAGVGSSRVRLLAGGGYRVEREAAVSGERIRSLLTRTVLFVCTGNTCRSPMAERIATGLLESRGAEPGLEAVSAGVAAGVGAHASEEIWPALRSVGVEIVDRSHRSQPVTRELLESAEAVFTMTGDHASQLLAAFPWASDRTQPLDLRGDVPDPIGGPQSIYDETAARLRTLIEQRLLELGLIGPGE